MELDPHTLRQIVARIEQQMRCPQCGKRVPVDFTSVRLAGDDFLLLQLRCETCDAFIVLHATLQGAEHLAPKKDATVNASSALHLKDHEIEMLHEALRQSGGSFEKLFKKFGGSDASAADTRIV
jgi:competence CoiA-like predicted nuclease